MTEIPVGKINAPSFQARMDFEEKIDEHAELEESHPGIIPEISDEKRRKMAKRESMLRSARRFLMVLEEYQANQPGITLVDWLWEVLA